MDFHEAAKLFPIDDENIQSLADDIRENGLITPIEIMDGKILDGRRRWAACQIAGVEPETTEVCPADPVGYSLSVNLHRRHLTTSQKAMVAARAKEMYEEEARERMKEGGKKGGESKGKENLPDPSSGEQARDAAGKAVGVSGKSVDHATKVIEKGTPELIKAVDEGRVAVSTAAKHVDDPPEEQNKLATTPKKERREKKVEPKSEAVAETERPVKSRGVGLDRAHEAIAVLKRIPKKDELRTLGFNTVMDWIKYNK